tara:strand:+ start:3793 stop:6684 length:2892 start_codon:yes stop_codon:yes gene_type:complete
MTARNYDLMLTVANAAAFDSGNVVVGTTTKTEAVIANVDLANNILKVKLNNVRQEFFASETLESKAANIRSQFTRNRTTSDGSSNVFYGLGTSNNVNEVHVALNNVLVHPNEYEVSLAQNDLILNFEGTGLGVGPSFKGSCFPAGTLVSTPFKGNVPIETLTLGDKVWCFDATDNKQISFIEKVWKHIPSETVNYILTITHENGSFRVTDNHYLYDKNNEYKEAKDWKVGEYLTLEDNSKTKIINIEKEDYLNDTVYNLTVNTYHNYIAEGIRLSNKGGGGKGYSRDEATFYQHTVFTGSESTVIKDNVNVKFGSGSARFTGVANSYLYIASHSDFDIMNSNKTLELFANITAPFSANQSLISRYETTANNYFLRVAANGKVNFVYRDAGMTEDINLQGGSITGNAYVHMAVVNNFDSGNVSLYVDGSRVDSQAYTFTSSSTTISNVEGEIQIGKSNTVGEVLTGYIDAVRMASNVMYDGASYTVPSAEPKDHAKVTLQQAANTTANVIVDVIIQTANTKAQPFEPAITTGQTLTATTTISSIAPSPYIKEKNAFTQNPIVRLISVYYPGEWYPPNSNGNPSSQGAGKAWPNDFPFRIAEINGDFVSDLQYNVTFDGQSYMPYPLNVSAIEAASDGKISEVTLTAFNMDNIISTLVEDPFLAGNNSSNSTVAFVNDEYVHGIDPRTVNAAPSDVGVAGQEAFDTLTRARANGLIYSEANVGIYGKSNASFTKDETISIGGSWTELKQDSRDLLGAVVEIKTTFMNFLDHWPEYSGVKTIASNVVEVVNAMPYRVGDNVQSSKGTLQATIQSIEENRFLFLSGPLAADTSQGDPVYIVNADADVESFVEDVFKINELESLNITTATFGLVSWLQYFKIVVPKRKYYKNTCQWLYKGDECQYPGPGQIAIPGTALKSATTNIAANNAASNDHEDVCSKSLEACTLRNNQSHFGGFPATGRTIPRA